MASSISRNVVKKILSRETSEVRAFLQHLTCTTSPQLVCIAGVSQGAGALVRRSIGSPELRNLTPFLMLDHFHIGKGAVRDMMSSSLCLLDVTHRRMPSGVICRVSPTTRIAARLQSATLFKVPVNTKTLQDMRVSFEKVVCNGCARYVPPSTLISAPNEPC